jgi:hypothetical protein
MRTRNTHVRGRIGLIRKGSKSVVGVADLVDTLPQLSQAALQGCSTRHRIPEGHIGEDFKHNTAWVLEHARPLRDPVPYCHPLGAVIWVNLGPEVTTVVEQKLVDG